MAMFCLPAIAVIFCLTTLTAADNCFECTTKIKASMEVIREGLRPREPIVLETPQPCPNCSFAGIVTIQADGDVCSVEVPPEKCDNQICHDHKINLYFTKVVMTCKCNIPVDPLEIMKLATSSMENPAQATGVKCANEDNVKKVGLEVPQFVGRANLADVKNCAECKPKPPPLGKIPEAGKRVGGEVIGTWPNFKMAVVLRACKGVAKVETISVTMVSKDLKEMSMKCGKAEDPGFKEACACFSKTDVAAHGFTDIVHNLFPCYGEEQFQDNDKLMRMMECTDELEEANDDDDK